ncbi:MAG TPA: hypothetical protein GX512_01800, partial [Firmicutes bacterium]|nr:hypothetical protein [Candidatus Fermentithermobacillaceae bacterium]
MSATRGEGSSRSIAQGAAIPAGAPGGNRPGASAGGAAKARPGQGAPQETQRPPRGPGGGPAFARPVEKAKDFRGTLKRLIAYLGPQKWLIVLSTTFSILSTLLNAFTPRAMGRA